MYKLDPDVVRWGLHLLDVCSLSNNGSPETLTCYENDLSQSVTVEEGFSDPTSCVVDEGFCYPTHSVVENDEVIAHALQEELSRLATAEASETASAMEENENESILSQDWLGHSKRFLNSGENNDQGALPEIEEESDLDGELGKRLNQMVSIPHIPKINGEIPSADEATSDHERLLKRLQLYDLVELKISGDGNCQFRSLADQIYRTPQYHKSVRTQVVNQLKSQPELYENYVPMFYGDYLRRMSKNGEWGDHVTLQAAADFFGIKIFVLTSFKDTCYIEILPQMQKSNRIIFLSFWAEVHYNSIYPSEEFPIAESKKKKRWWWT
ncbi:OVARIAN TUMOR DOMAIN-containing deubiquitinating enzyme 12-like [Henckelia pumila]|uniref:OVARIAN TUMOR DOMAIN-containing deubiquitinating enzyme 12-like n=1 Tax=Henckelia pumila TaxID=405737 RepID=UPI003C6E8518